MNLGIIHENKFAQQDSAILKRAGWRWGWRVNEAFDGEGWNRLHSYFARHENSWGPAGSSLLVVQVLIQSNWLTSIQLFCSLSNHEGCYVPPHSHNPTTTQLHPVRKFSGNKAVTMMPAKRAKQTRNGQVDITNPESYSRGENT